VGTKVHVTPWSGGPCHGILGISVNPALHTSQADRQTRLDSNGQPKTISSGIGLIIDSNFLEINIL